MKRKTILVALTMALGLAAIGWLPSGATRASGPAVATRAPIQGQLGRPIRTLPGVTNIAFWIGPNTLGGATGFGFGVNSSELTRLSGPLGPDSKDFTDSRAVPTEFYDVFYSDADGTPNIDGSYITVESAGAGLGLGEIWLQSGVTANETGNSVASFVALGDNADPGSVGNAIDNNISTFTRLGNTPVGQSQRLRITIGFPSASPPPCTYSISPTGQTFPSAGGTGTINITTQPGCKWSAFVPPPSPNPMTGLIQLTSANNGSGNGTISYSVMPVSLTDTAPRLATIQIRNEDGHLQQTFWVTWEGVACPDSAYSISPGQALVDGEGYFGSFQVTAPIGCSWTARSGVPWIKIESGTGSGSRDVSYDVDENDGTWRTGSIAVGAKGLTVYQDDKYCALGLVCAFFPGVCLPPSSALATSRCFRDTVLSKTPRGRRYTQLYYRFGREAVQSMLLQPSLLLRSREIMQGYLPVVEAIVKGEKPTLTQGDLEEIDGFLNAFAARGSPDLRETVKELCQELKDPQVHAEFGLTVTEGPKRELPGRVQLQGMKRIGGIAIFSGLWTLLIFAATGKRRKALSRHAKSMLVVVLASAVVASGLQGPMLSGQPNNADSFITAPKTQSRIAERYLRPPIAFESNQGQVDSQVKFVSPGQGYTMFLTPTEAVMKLTNRKSGIPSQNQTRSQLPTGRFPLSSSPATDPRPSAPDILRMKLVGANPNPPIQGLDQLPSVSNYFIGRDATKWRTDVPAYARVKYAGVYPGVDMVYYANRGELEYDLIVAPAADLKAISLDFAGADRMEVDEQGDLILRVAGGEMRQRRPVIYQEVNGTRREISGRYIISHREVGFEIGAYNKTMPLIIDPVLDYSTYFGGGGTDEGNSIAVDAAGNAYIVGFTDSLNFPTIDNSQPNFGGGQQDAFIVKLDPSGTRVIYSTYLGGDDQDNGTGIAVDAAGNAYVTGYTGSTNFPVRNALQPTKAGAFNAFVVRLNPTGSLRNSTLLGGSFSDYGSSIAVDSTGAIYVAGIATSPNFPMANAVQPAFGGSADVYVAKLDPSGARIMYSTYLGGAEMDGASSIAVDAAGNVYLTGLTSSPNFRTVNPLQSTHGGGIFDAFVTKLNPAGTQVLYSTYLGGSSVDRSFRIAVDAAGSAYVVGDTDSTNFPVTNGVQQSNGGSSDAFASKLSPSGNQLVYSTYLGGGGIDGGTAIAVDPSGNAYVTGFTASTNFPTINPIQQSLSGAYDGFVAKIASSGSILDYSTYLGGSGIDSGFGIAADASGNAYVMGVTDSLNFPTAAPFQSAHGGGRADVFAARIKSSGPTITRAEIQGKNLLVFGSAFDDGAKILLKGEQQKTRNDEVNPTGALFGKKVGKKVTPGETVTLQVRNSDGALSNEFSFTRPAQ